MNIGRPVATWWWRVTVAVAAAGALSILAVTWAYWNGKIGDGTFNLLLGAYLIALGLFTVVRQTTKSGRTFSLHGAAWILLGAAHVVGYAPWQPAGFRSTAGAVSALTLAAIALFAFAVVRHVRHA